MRLTNINTSYTLQSHILTLAWGHRQFPRKAFCFLFFLRSSFLDSTPLSPRPIASTLSLTPRTPYCCGSQGFSSETVAQSHSSVSLMRRKKTLSALLAAVCISLRHEHSHSFHGNLHLESSQYPWKYLKGASGETGYIFLNTDFIWRFRKWGQIWGRSSAM